MSKKQILHERLSSYFGLAMLILGAVAASDFLGNVRPVGAISLTQIAALLATVAGIVARWAAQQLPSADDLKNAKAKAENGGSDAPK